MSRFVLLLTCVASLLAGSRPAEAVIVYATGFEDPPFAPGSQLLGQDGWTTAIPPFLNPSAATITAAVARSGLQSVQVRGADLVGSDGITAPYDAVGSYRRPVDYTVTPGAPVLRVEADLRLDTTSPATTTDFFSLTIATRSGSGETLGEFGLSSLGVATAFGFDVMPGADPLFTAPIAFNQWYHLAIELDFAARTTSYLLDGGLLGTTPSPSSSDVLARGALVVYALPDSGGDARANYTARFDNLSITAVPEPSGLVSLGIGILITAGWGLRLGWRR